MSVALLYLVPVALLGLAIGSFLNVVIYRLPRDLSVSQPRWSFCPLCGNSIRWHDNVPVLGWLRLRGRCRDCRAPISLQYPVVELLTAFVFVAVYDALFLGRTVAGVTGIPADAVLLIACWFVFATLLANAVMDLEAYIIDVRLTYWAMAVGVIGRALWPALRGTTTPPDFQIGMTAAAIGVVALPMLWYAATRPMPQGTESDASLENESSPGEHVGIDAARVDNAADRVIEERIELQSRDREGAGGFDSDSPLPHGRGSDGNGRGSERASQTPSGSDGALPTGAPETAPAGDPNRADALASEPAPVAEPPRAKPHGPLPIMLLTLLLVALVAAPFFADAWPATWPTDPFSARAGLTLVVLCFVLILAAMQPRPADDEMAQTLEFEMPAARRVALRELVWLLPMIAAGAATYLAVGAARPSLDWSSFFGGRASALGLGLMGGTDGLIGLLSGAAIGWGVRIFFTLVFGKEAFGTGDIYLLAAIGALTDAWTCVIAFFAAALLGLLGVAAALFRKSCRAIPFGPWLAVGALVGLWVRGPVAARLGPAFVQLWKIITHQPLDAFDG